MAKAKAATAIDLIIVFLPCEPSTRDFSEGMSNKLNHRRTQFNMVGCRTYQAADKNDGSGRKGIGSHERLRPQHRKGSATEQDLPHGLVYGEELPACCDEPQAQ
jgi:hypothetical protein